MWEYRAKALVLVTCYSRAYGTHDWLCFTIFELAADDISY